MAGAVTPSREVRAFDVTIPANTPQSAPVTIGTMFPDRVVNRIEITIPPGPSGLMGFQLWVLGAQVIPHNQGSWIIGDDRQISWDVHSMPDTGSWQVTGYNTDIYDHTIHVDYLLDTVPLAETGVASAAAQQTTRAVLGMSSP